MKKAYCTFPGMNKQAIDILKNNNIELTINNTAYRANGEELISLLIEYDILIIGIKSFITKDILQYIKTPKIIATSSIGLDHIDKEVIDSELVKVINIKTANSLSVAEHIFSLILALNKRIYESNNLVLNHNGNRSIIHDTPQDISEKTLGLIGAGNITKEVIKIATVFNMKINCYTRNPSKHQDLLQYNVNFESLDDVLKQSDIVNISIPLTYETNNLISKDKIELLKPTATFINTSRRDIVDTNALIEYADKNTSFYVGLDIDLDDYEDLFAKYRDNVIVTPHTAGVSKQAMDRMDFELVNSIVSYLKNEKQ